MTVVKRAAARILLSGASAAMAAGFCLIAITGSAQAYGPGAAYGQSAVAEKPQLIRKTEIRDGKSYVCEYWKGELRDCELSRFEKRKRFRENWQFN